MPGTRALRTFEAAARHLNFTRAADEVGLTPAAVSYQIKEIEDQLGILLFIRTSRSIKLTPAGSILLEATVEALDALRVAAARARKLTRGEAYLRVTADPVFAGKWLMPRVDAFRKAHPDIELRFDISHGVRDFEHDDVDIGIRFGAGRYPGIVAHRLFDDLTVVPVCSPGLLRAEPRIETPADLKRHTLAHIEWSRPGIVWPNWAMWMAAAGVEDFDDSVCVVFGESSQLIQAAMAGSAVALVDFAMVAKDLSEGRLVRPFGLGIKLPPEFAYFLVYPETSAEDRRIAAFRDWIAQEAGKPHDDPRDRAWDAF